jgi:hypothetical protein
MAETRPALRAVDRLEVTILGDNSIDVFLPHENFRKLCSEQRRYPTGY